MKNLDTGQHINHFLDEIEQKLSGIRFNPKNHGKFESLPLINNQCAYIVNYKERAVTFQKGVKELWGYDEDEFTFDLVHNYIHPDDKEVVTRLMKGTILCATNQRVSVSETFFHLCYRARKKNGEYLKVLRQSGIFETDDQGLMVSSFSILSDISYMDSSNRVDWVFKGPEIDVQEFKKFIYASYKDYFSNREQEILGLLKDGFSSKQISELLFISKNTVDTHRRNMLHKSGSQNTLELVNFALKNGII